MNKHYNIVREYLGDNSCLPPAAYLHLFNSVRNPNQTKHPSYFNKLARFFGLKVTTTSNK
jgi:hypothetical protein